MRVSARVCVRRWAGPVGTVLLPEALSLRLSSTTSSRQQDNSDTPMVVLVRSAIGAVLAEASRGRWEAGAGVGMDGEGERLEDDCVYVPPGTNALTDGAPVTIRVVKAAAIALDRVVLMTEMKGSNGTSSLNGHESIIPRGVLRRGAVVHATDLHSLHTAGGVYVADCAPLVAGLITPTTTICLVPQPYATVTSQPPSPSSSYASLSTLVAPSSPSASPSSSVLLSSPVRPSPLLLSSFVRSPLSPSSAPVTHTINLHTLATPLTSPLPPPPQRDVLLEAAVSPSQLRALALFSGSWLRLSSGSQHAAVRVCADRMITTDGLHVSPAVAARLAPTVSLSSLAASDTTLATSLPLATRVVVARIRTPSSSGHVSYAAPLRALFARPRPVCMHELLAAPLTSPPSTLYFQIIQIEPAGLPVALLDASRSVLVTEGSVNSALPPALPSFLRPAPSSFPASLFANSPLATTLDSLLAPLLSPLAPSLSLRASALLVGPRGSGVRATLRAACERRGMHLLDVNVLSLPTAVPSVASANAPSASASALRRTIEQAADSAPCVLLLRHAAHLDALTLSSALASASAWPTAIIGTVETVDGLAPALRAVFLHEIQVAAPDEPERLAMLQVLTRGMTLSRDVSLQLLAAQSASLVLRDLRAVVAEAARAALNDFVKRAATNATESLEQEADVTESEEEVQELFSAAGPCVSAAHLSSALNAVQATHQGAMARIPRVTWADVGGLGDAKAELLDTVQLPLRMPHLFSGGLRKRSGVLLYGPPGTGKTLLAKAVATECSLNFMSVKGPELINMYVGESERNVREVFRKARAARPCVVFFDELDSLAPNRGRGADSGGVADRVVAQLLTELDGMSKAAATDVFVIGATNRPELLDPALLIPGRFDRLVYLGVPSEPSTRLAVLTALTRKFRLGSGVSLEALAAKCPTTFTGADCYALCAEALMHALEQRVASLEKKLSQKNVADPAEAAARRNALANEGAIEVTVEDFDAALASIRPSLSREELARYDALHAKHRITKT